MSVNGPYINNAHVLRAYCTGVMFGIELAGSVIVFTVFLTEAGCMN